MAVDDVFTVALLHMNGADASTTFTDESGKTWTAVANAQIDTAQSKFGGASGLFDGTGDEISTSDSADFYFTGDFTIDFWVRWNSLPSSGNAQYLYHQGDGSNNFERIYLENAAGTYKWTYDVYNNNVLDINVVKSSPGLSTGTWYHFALTRSGNDYRIFQDGTQVGTTVTDSSSHPNVANDVKIGGRGSTSHFNGWLDEFRVSNGVARWTADFTPQTTEYAPSSAAQVIWFS